MDPHLEVGLGDLLHDRAAVEAPRHRKVARAQEVGDAHPLPLRHLSARLLAQLLHLHASTSVSVSIYKRLQVPNVISVLSDAAWLSK